MIDTATLRESAIVTLDRRLAELDRLSGEHARLTAAYYKLTDGHPCIPPLDCQESFNAWRVTEGVRQALDSQLDGIEGQITRIEALINERQL